MGDSKQERMDQLLSEGLDHYGLDEIAKAILAWEQVLVLDPGNSAATDYIQTADRRTVPRPKKGGGELKGALEQARNMMRGGQDALAYELLHNMPMAGEMDLEYEATVELVRARLHRGYSERVVDTDRIPQLRADAGSLEQYNLPPDAGFLLSIVDGRTSVAELISLSGMDSFQALHTLNGLLDSGILELPQL